MHTWRLVELRWCYRLAHSVHFNVVNVVVLREWRRKKSRFSWEIMPTIARAKHVRCWSASFLLEEKWKTERRCLLGVAHSHLFRTRSKRQNWNLSKEHAHQFISGSTRLLLKAQREWHRALFLLFLWDPKKVLFFYFCCPLLLPSQW